MDETVEESKVLVPVKLTAEQLAAIKHNLKVLGVGVAVGMGLGFVAAKLIAGENDGDEMPGESASES